MTAGALGRIAASGLVLGMVVWLVDPAALGARLAGTTPGWMALAAAVLVAQVVLSALRWQLTARALGQRLPTLWAVSEYHLAVLGNTLLPGGVLGDLGRTARAAGPSGGWRAAVQSVVIERAAGQVALGAVTLWGLAWFLAQAGAGRWVAGLLLLAPLVWVAARALPAGWRAVLARAWLARRVWPSQLGLSAAIVACNLGGVWAAARAVGVELGAGPALFVIPLTLLAMLVPLSVNGWGLREGAAAAVWPLVGVPAADAVAASVAFGLAALIAALGAAAPWTVRLARPAPQGRPE